MKLISEYTDCSIEYITEVNDKGKKETYIEGIFMESNKKNRNKRIYKKDILEKAVQKYVTEQVNTGRAVGELNHPEGPGINLDKVSHKITSLKWVGENVVGKALVLNTPMGQIVKGLLEGGVKLGVSSRGMGTVESTGNGVSYVKSDFQLATVDIVQDPSAKSAFVNGIMEGMDFVWNNGLIEARQIEKYETAIKEASLKELGIVQEKVFTDFLSKLK